MSPFPTKTNLSQKPIAETIKNIFSVLTEEPKQRNSRLVEKWFQIAGTRVAKRTKPVFRGKTIVIQTSSSALAFELSRHYGDAILKRLQNEFGEDVVKKIWFCVGETSLQT